MRRTRDLRIIDPVAAETVAALARQAGRHETPCGAGQMVWHVWGAGPPLLLCHGGSGSWTHWFHTIPALAARYQVFVPDLPGLGDSAMPDAPLTPHHSAEIVVAGFRRLVGAEAKVQVAGFSYGGQVATLAGALLAGQLTGLTLIGVAALGLFRMERATMARLHAGMTQDEVIAAHRHNLAVLMFADAARIDPLALYIQAENVRRGRFESRPFATTDAIRRTLPAIRAPLTSIYGEKDIVAAPSLPARFEVMREHHPELQTRTIPGSGHWVMYEAADAFNAALLELLAGTTGSA